MNRDWEGFYHLEYDVPPEEAARDCQEFIDSLVEQGLYNRVMPRVRHEVS